MGYLEKTFLPPNPAPLLTPPGSNAKILTEVMIVYCAYYPVLSTQTRLPFYLSGAGTSDPEYHVVREKGLVSFQILYTRRGSGILRVDGKELRQTPGSIFFLSPGVPHEYFPEGGCWETAWIVFRGKNLPEEMEELGFGRWHSRDGAELSGCERIFSQILSAVQDPVNGGERCSMLVYEYVLEARRMLLSGGSPGGGLTGAAVELMEKEFSRDITLEELAGLCGVSLQHFCRVFRAQHGMRPMEYLARRRVSEAKRLLGTTGISVAEISAMVGYSTPTYFGTVFRRYEGISPSEYRLTRAL